MNEFINFDEISRETWQNLYKTSLAPLTKDELDSIRSLNDEISLKDVSDVYLPLVHLLRVYKKNLEDMSFTKGLFLQKIVKTPPLIIGISGSVAVGKSTTARLLKVLLSRAFGNTSVALVTTDGFLYSNKELESQGILDQKGFPESYDMERLLDFLYKMKSGQDAEIPVYSHEFYDIVENETQKIANPDILIVEGINVLQNPDNQLLYISDFYDFSIYVDADEKMIEKWFRERFDSLLKMAKNDPQNFYHQFTKLSDERIEELISETWQNINLRNLHEYIEPTRNRAEVIIHKAAKHYIDKLYLKKF
ncbi:type I pantothenate kinase [Lactovum miscens]|uniref:Pantothenate kinase n=1 Tax=Lactovum miscens TaxID=190387 RepID=A0A841C7V8_9LACT|nr:type I pantothenate kinase [Lactovum miscens]MBB5888434.1 type I pantothenate kinase [Lactovum miscens]